MKRVAAATALFAMLYVANPPDEPRFRLCGFYWLTGLLCPLCGLTRGVCALAKGHVAAAVHWNALSPVAMAMLFSLFWDHPLRGRLWTAGIVAFAGYGVLRVFTS